MTLEQLQTERDRIEAEISAIDEDTTRIKSQLEHAKANGNADPHWAASARTAMRYKNRKLQELQSSLGKVNREIKAVNAKAFDTRFIDVARRELPKETYVSILSQVSA
jgi:peptidoglycan hydrolase CwlO-like protein